MEKLDNMEKKASFSKSKILKRRYYHNIFELIYIYILFSFSFIYFSWFDFFLYFSLNNEKLYNYNHMILLVI